MGDLLDPPGRGTEQERLTHPAFEHHLLVQLADPGGRSAFADQEYAIQSAIRNRPAVDDRDALRALHAR